MKKSMIITIAVILISMLALTGIVVSAAEVKAIGSNEIIPKSQFVVATEMNNEGTIKGDLFVGAKSITSTGIIQGDLVAGGENISSSGSVLGDIISGGSQIDISGTVGGNIRSGGSTISIDGIVGKNVNVFSEKLQIKKNTEIGGNLLALGSNIRIDGKVKGYTKIDGNRITLNGEFFGDVDINMEVPNSLKNNFSWQERKGDVGLITILPGTIIHGKLTYKSTKEADISAGAVVNNPEWIPVKVQKAEKSLPSSSSVLWSFVKMLLATAVYFLIAFLLFKLFPGIFKYQSDLIANKPLRAAGIGFIGIVSILGVFIGFIILTILAFLFSSASLAAVIGLNLFVFYVVLFYLATLPFAMWLGNLIFKDRYTMLARFALGLSIVSLGLFVLEIMTEIPEIGGVVEFIKFIAELGITALGIGALLTIFGKVFGSIRKLDFGPQEENSVE